ncbi:MAG: Flp pilus assembly complex ATPase component [Oligoflexia bacterium]|nr:Flp pilus assembly complex ATPase component [Oligoflexia bacterium]
MARTTSQRLGDLLVLAGKITRDQLAEALERQTELGHRLGSTLVQLGYLTEDELTRFLATQQGVDGASDQDLEMDPAMVKLLSADFVKRFEVVPVRIEDGDVLVVACATPNNLDLLDEVRFVSGHRQVRAIVASEAAIRRAIETNYATHSLLEEVIASDDIFEQALRAQAYSAPRPGAAPDLHKLETDSNKQPIVALINYLLAEAMRRAASDIHIEPYKDFLRVRMRIDGILHPIITPPPSLHKALISRVKIMAGMDISKNRVPQDGHIGLDYLGEVLHYRVNILPTVYGEKCVIRLLRKDARLSDLDRLGISPNLLTQFKRVIHGSQGLVLVTGPTGSGKTTTVLAALDAINDIKTNVVTLEDPFESGVAGINHVQVDNKSGLTFLTGMRAILRQDPDVIFLGEIRDSEVANTAMDAALTGHLVFSTLHTNSAVEALNRLEDLGIQPFMVAGTLKVVLAQRLVRRICEHCAMEITPRDDELEAMGLSEEDLADARFRRGRGCNHCMNSGFKGRLGVYEALFVDKDIRELIRAGADVSTILDRSRASGMRALSENALDLITQGLTTLEEVRRCISED